MTRRSRMEGARIPFIRRRGVCSRLNSKIAAHCRAPPEETRGEPWAPDSRGASATAVTGAARSGRAPSRAAG
jgi:hypothetical protein